MNNRKALILVEVLVVIAIIGVLVALLLPAFHTAFNASPESVILEEPRHWNIQVIAPSGEIPVTYSLFQKNKPKIYSAGNSFRCPDLKNLQYAPEGWMFFLEEE